jgi:hypothetical protein
MEKEWSPEEEAARLRARFAALSERGAKADFAAASAYANGFGVTLTEISPRLANEIAAAASQPGGHAVEEEQAQYGEDVVPSSEEEWRLFRAFRHLKEDEQRQALAQLEEFAAKVLGHRFLEGTLGASGYASDDKVSRAFGTPLAPRKRKS